MRRADRLLFLEGTYRAIDGGPHVVAFELAHRGKRLVCVVPRLPWKLAQGWPLGGAWGDATLAVGGERLRNVFTGEVHEGDSLRLRELFATFPVAWLV
jgi:maltooligosyltrehalose synthase